MTGVRSYWIPLAVGCLFAAGCPGGGETPQPQAPDGNRPMPVSTGIKPLTFTSAYDQVIVIHQLSSGKTRLLIRPKTHDVQLVGRRLAWSEGTTVLHCDLPEGDISAIRNDTHGGRVAVLGNRLAYETADGVRLCDSPGGSTQDFRMEGPFCQSLTLTDEVLVYEWGANAEWFRYVRLADGTIVNPEAGPKRSRAIVGWGSILFVGRSWQDDRLTHFLGVVDTATGKVKRRPLPTLFEDCVKVGSRLIGAGRRHLGTYGSLHSYDLETGRTAEEVKTPRFDVRYGLHTDGRRVVWAENYDAPARRVEVCVRLWDTATGEVRDVSEEARANFPKFRIRGPGPEGRLSRPFDLLHIVESGSIHVSDDFVVWIQDSAPHPKDPL